ncbi:glycosyltransferase family 4 protein [Pedobacter metabolipauper]|uniref:Glycosyltransferase involved in cell wall biosynthesis n=1 Tax=Pedobacter metabolipauper TaxID=425513 RepID=A0A4R6SZF8_9SPHI|nr:glycosyltransferase family 4 protein [Pedobacter metabolipauper]TDQ09935.1 glycosyltransferase involved in cell wall biosynthesis [Pedobacter metabolipauper]
MNKIKVLHIIKSLGRGGAEMLLPETLKLHDHQRYEFHYIYFLPWKNQLEDVIKDAGGFVTCFPAKNNIQLMMQWKKVQQYIKQHEIVLVHCHLPWAGFLGRLVHRNTGIPLVYTEHNKQERYHNITFRLNKWTFNSQNKAIAVSADVSESIQKNIKPQIPVKVILNGVNTVAFQRNIEDGIAVRKQWNLPEKAIVIGTIAVFRFQKRLLEWMEVMAGICAENDQVFGIIVGDGPLKQEIVDKRKALGLEKKILMPGLETDVKPWLSTMDIYMMSSVFEGLPIALLEAMSMSCAIVTTDAGGIKEVIRNGEDGLMVPADDWKLLGSELTKLIKDEPKRLELALNARQRVQSSFSLDKMVKELEETYLEMLE